MGTTSEFVPFEDCKDDLAPGMTVNDYCRCYLYFYPLILVSLNAKLNVIQHLEQLLVSLIETHNQRVQDVRSSHEKVKVESFPELLYMKSQD